MRAALRGHGPTVLVAGLAAAFGVGLIGATRVLVLAAESSPAVLALETAQVVLSLLAYVFMGISIYVAAIVTTNTVATIVAGRVREIALVRLLGATAARERARIAREGLAAGALGAALGSAAGLGVIAAFVPIGVATGVLPGADYPFLAPAMGIPVVAVVLSTWLAAWVGSRRVLAVTPVEALGAAAPADAATLRTRRGRGRAAAITGGIGVALLALGALAGQLTPLGVLIGIAGGVLSFSGLMIGAPLFLPHLLAVVGRLLGRDPAAVLGTRNALRYPERSSRAAIALVIGVALVTMFVVAGSTADEIVRRRMLAEWGRVDLLDGPLGMMLAIVGFLVGFSAVIAAVGLVNTLTVGVLQRTREFGLVRALGLSRGQLRRTVAIEAVQLALTAVLVGFAAGVGYGWVGAQSMIGSQQWGVGVVPPIVPWWLVVGIAAVAVVLALAGSLLPARRAVRITPVEALAVD